MTVSSRWQALDWLRGLTIIFMLLNLMPGAWDQQYGWLTHVKWEGFSAIDWVAPAFLFCVGAGFYVSLQKRLSSGAARGDILRHIWIRAGLIVLIGLFLNAYPAFDFAHMRIPGVLQRIGLAYGLAASLVVFLTPERREISLKSLWIAFALPLVVYWAWLQFVPVPGFWAGRFDPVGNWAAYLDRLILTEAHMYPWGAIDGKVYFDPEGILSTIPTVSSVLFGVIIARYHQNVLHRQNYWGAVFLAVAMMGVGVLLHPVLPIIKNLWTPSFVLLTSGLTVGVLAILSWVESYTRMGRYMLPVTAFGVNPLLAYILTFLAEPIADGFWTGYSLRTNGQAFFSQFMAPKDASFAFSLIWIVILAVAMLYCYRKKWFLKL